MTNIKDVAKEAGVSIGTVSNVINNLANVSKDNKRKVLRAVRKLEYKPNMIARSLIKGETKICATIVPDINIPFFPELVRGITDYLEAGGYHTFVSSSNNDLKKEKLYIQDCLSLLVRGIIIAPTDSEVKNIEFFNDLNIPMVVVDREINGLKRDLIIVNNHRGSYEAVSFLISQGHKIIVILCGPNYTNTAKNRYKGWETAMREHGLFRNDLVYWGDFTIDSGYKMMKKGLNDLKKIDAVFATNDFLAIGAMQAIKENNLAIPDDVSIIGFDDIYISRLLQPSLTTIKQPTYLMGTMAAEILLKRINRKTDSDNVENVCRYVVDGELILRDSVKGK